MSLARRTGGVLGSNFVALAFAAATQVVITRALSAEQRGYYDAGVGLAALGAVVMAFGWPNAAIHQLRARSTPARDVATLAVGGVVVLGLLTLVVTWASRGFISGRLMAGAPTNAVVPVAIALSLSLASQTFGAIARGMDWFARFNVARIIDAATVLGATTLLLLLVGDTATLALTGAAIGDGIATAFLLFTVVRAVGVSRTIDWRVAVSGARYGSKAYVQSLSGLVHERVDVLLLAVLAVEPQEIGKYGVAVVVVNLLRSVPEAVGTSAFPQLAALDAERSARLAARLCRMSVGISVVTGAIALAVAPVVIPAVFGSAYADSVVVLALLVPASIGLAIYRILGRWFLAVDEHRAGITTQVLALVLNIGLNLALIPSYGTMGAAASTLVSYTISGADIARRFSKSSDVRLLDALVPKRSDLRALRGSILKRDESGAL